MRSSAIFVADTTDSEAASLLTGDADLATVIVSPSWMEIGGVITSASVDPSFRTAMLRGRPLGSGKKTSVTLRLDTDILEAFRASGKGWQTRLNGVLREWLDARSV